MLRRILFVCLAWLCACTAWCGRSFGTDSLEMVQNDEALAVDSLREDLEAWGEEVVAEALDERKKGFDADSLLKVGLSKVETFTPDPLRSFWLSLILPGAGQIYNHKYWKLPVVYGGFLGCVYALSWNGQMLSDYTQAYLDIMDDDPNTKSYEKMLPLGYDIRGKEERFKEVFKRKKNYYRKYRDMSIFAFAGVYLISVIDAYVDAELSSFDISRDLSLKWEPTRMNGDNALARRFSMPSYGVQCSLSF